MAQGTLNAVQTLRATIGFDVYTKPEVDALLDEKADKTDTYTKEETNSLLDDKADKSTTYTKTEVDNALSLKANSADVYTKTEADALLDEKADADAVYTKTETDTLLSAKADKSTTLAGYGITDAYTKTETDTLLNGKADADSVYTKQEIDTKIPSSVGSATKPTYVNGGVITECTYELNKTVPANAVFTDTTYSAGNGLNLSGTSFSAKAGTNVTVDGGGINVNGNGAVASADSGLINGGTAYTELRPTLDGTWVKNAQTTATNLQKLEGGIEYLYGLLSHQYDQLKKYINGNYYDYDTDANSKYTKSVPAGAMPWASLDSVGGKTVVWNQLSSMIGSSMVVTSNGVTFTFDSNALTCTLSGTASGGNAVAARGVKVVAGHKYLLKGCPSGGGSNYYQAVSGQLADVGSGAIFTESVGGTRYIIITVANGTNADGLVFRSLLFDLTLMFGAGNEPTTVAEFQQMFPAQYYPYNAGTLLSAGVTEVKSVGKNLADYSGGQGYPSDTTSSTATKRIYEVGKWVKDIAFSNSYVSGRVAVTVGENSISVTTATGGYGVGIPFNCDENTVYSFSFIPQNSTLCAIMWYAKDGTFISNKTIANPTSAGYTYTSPANATQGVLLLTTNQTNVQCSFTNIQIEKSATATTYSPYKKITYPIPAEVQALTGYGWSAGTAYNYIDYERKVFVKCVDKIVLDGTQTIQLTNWRPQTNTVGWGYPASMVNVKKPQTNSDQPNIVADSVMATYYTNLYQNDIRGIGVIQASDNTYSFFVRGDSTLTNSTAINTYLSANPLTVYYELATPIETDISQYLTDDNLIEVEAGGSLTFPNSNGDNYRIPVPSAETYMVDLQSALGE